MAEELCEEDIRKAFESGRLGFKRSDRGFMATLVPHIALIMEDPSICIEFIVREEHDVLYEGVVQTVHIVGITDKRLFTSRQTTCMRISQSLYEAIRYKVQEDELRDENAFRRDVKALLRGDTAKVSKDL